MKPFYSHFIKGLALGSANIIPGVSGGTIALITGIFERLISAIKSIDIKCLKLLFSGKWKAFCEHTDLYFLLTLFSGIFIAILSLAKAFDYLFTHYSIYIWAFFFGLILSSIYYVSKNVSKWKWDRLLTFAIGSTIALLVTFLTPASENSHMGYLFLCGIVGMCSMILPGLSGSFVLILMGNYELIMIKAVGQMQLDILLPVGFGAIFGLLALSHILSWILKHWHDQTLAFLTGFIFGSLGVLWPWKNPIFLTDNSGEVLLKNGKEIINGYHYFFPQTFSLETIIAFSFIILGIVVIIAIEKTAKRSTTKKINGATH